MTSTLCTCQISTSISSIPGSVDIRLKGGTNSEGRVEVRRAKSDWGGICDYDFDDRDATVVCKMLGYPNGVAVPTAYERFGWIHNSASMFMNRLNCLGNETSILDCQYAGWGKSNCGQMYAAGVKCFILGSYHAN